MFGVSNDSDAYNISQRKNMLIVLRRHIKFKSIGYTETIS